MRKLRLRDISVTSSGHTRPIKERAGIKQSSQHILSSLFYEMSLVRSGRRQEA